jgi:hypothetical protein
MNNQPELEIDILGTKRWLLNQRYHREDGPAYESHEGIKAWFLNGNRHRTDGPAIERLDGSIEWWLNNKWYSTKAEWFQSLTPEQQYNYLWNLVE